MSRFLLVALLLLTVVASSGCYTTGHGSHVGYITASECSGIVGTRCAIYVKTDTESTQEDKYCVDSERGDFGEIWPLLQDLQRQKAHVEVDWHTEAATRPARCGGMDYEGIVDAVRVVA